MFESLIAWLLIGAIAGWLASLIVKGHGLGLAGNIVVGIVGAVIAGWLLPLIGFVFLGGILAASSTRLSVPYFFWSSSDLFDRRLPRALQLPAIELFIGRC